MVLAFLTIGPFELVLLMLAAVMLFGGDLPGMLRKAGRLAGRLRRVTADLSRMIDEAADEPKRPPPPPKAPPRDDAPLGPPAPPDA